ncbi:MAG: hypothetical protein ACRDGM_08905 [bacterium]
MKTLAVSRITLALLLLASFGFLPVFAQARVALAATCPPPIPGFFACELMAGLGRLIPQRLANVEATVQLQASNNTQLTELLCDPACWRWGP